MIPDQIWSSVAVAFGGATLALIGIGWADRRTLDGERVWSKPIKFGLSLAIHFATFAIIARFLDPMSRNGNILWATAVVSSIAAVLELAYIALQAARLRQSHFNMATTFESTMFMMMGIGAVVLLSPAAVIGLIVIAVPPAGWTGAVRVGVAAGLLGGMALATITGARMGATLSRYAAPPPRDPGRMWLTGWSLNAGDLRPAHFLAVHMIQIVPLAALLSSLVLDRSTALLATISIMTAWIILVFALFQHTITAKRVLPGRYRKSAG